MSRSGSWVGFEVAVTKPLHLNWTLGGILSLRVTLCLFHQPGNLGLEKDLPLLQGVVLFPLSQGYGVILSLMVILCLFHQSGNAGLDLPLLQVLSCPFPSPRAHSSVERRLPKWFLVTPRTGAEAKCPVSSLPVIPALPRSGFCPKSPQSSLRSSAKRRKGLLWSRGFLGGRRRLLHPEHKGDREVTVTVTARLWCQVLPGGATGEGFVRLQRCFFGNGG